MTGSEKRQQALLRRSAVLRSPLVPDAVAVEIARHDWESIECGCGRSAGHLVDAVRDAAEGHPSAFHALEGHVFFAEHLKPPAPAVCGVLMAVWAAHPPRQATREALLWTLLALLCTVDDGGTHEAGLHGQCAAFIRTGVDGFRREVATAPGSGTAAYAEGILDILGLPG
ncbi:hypothetical protein DEJ51_01615 [Streptomyces venezuelae]|uniref:Uncharacterized protein n=1 Tax=Streptomyces venezuelae TaxID=54571 RepID=A0A5P2DD75_STRVZ|nr:hypothetical protein [Streptomyces venezuelae]QES53114.1 hypothetical protein DEJ51_01615 [Streptomyces venezuelae]